jgi:hypothetical protein
MLSDALIRQYAHGARVSPEVAGADIVLHYALALLNEHGLIGRQPDGGPAGPLMFKGGTALTRPPTARSRCSSDSPPRHARCACD